MTLCMLGGVIGIGLGIGAAYLTASLAEWPVLIAPETVLLAMAAAAGYRHPVRLPAGAARRSAEPDRCAAQRVGPEGELHLAMQIKVNAASM